MCKEVFKIKNNFKYHMIKHYRYIILSSNPFYLLYSYSKRVCLIYCRPDLRKFLNEAAPTLCPVCGLNGANYDSTLGHVAWTHQKIRELLTPGILICSILTTKFYMSACIYSCKPIWFSKII